MKKIKSFLVAAIAMAFVAPMFIACGDDDGLSVNNGDLHAVLNQVGYKHEYRISEGAHDWKFWRSITPEVMKFVSDAFRM